VSEEAIPGDFAETDNDADAGQRRDFRGQVHSAVANLLGCGLVAGRGTANDGGDPRVTQAQAIVAGDGAIFRGEAELMQYGIHEIAGAVAREGAAGAIRTMRSGSEAQNQHAGAGITEAGDRPRPVIVVTVGCSARLTNMSTVGTQAGAEAARDDRFANAVKIFGIRLTPRLGHEDGRQRRRQLLWNCAANGFHEMNGGMGADGPTAA
jgi:hypothetical protein